MWRFIRPGCSTRREAADLIAELLPPGGLTSAAGTCPHCDFPLKYIHDGIPFAEAGTNFWTVYECVRCGAQQNLGDSHPYAVLDEEMRRRP